MPKLEVGIRYDLQNGPAFFGLEEVNALIASGAVVTAIEPAAVITTKLGATPEAATLTISGFAMNVVLHQPGEPPEA